MADYYQALKEEERKKKTRKIRFIIFLVFLSLLIIAGIILIKSPLSKILVVSADSKNNTQVEEKFWELIKPQGFWNGLIFGDNNSAYFLIKGAHLRDELLKSFPIFKDITLSINLLDKKVSIITNEREKVGIICFIENCSWFDDSGLAFLEGPSSQGSLVMKINDLSRKNIAIGDYFLEPEYFKNLMSAVDLLKALNFVSIQLNIKNIELAEVETESVSPKFYFSLKNNPLFALKALRDMEDTLTKISYVDLRVKNRIYYK